MLELLIAAGIVAALIAISIRADARFAGRDRLPMQWSFSGKVSWTAPRRLALAFTPALGALALGGIACAALLSGDARPGQEDMGPAVVLLVGAAFLAAHLLHLRIIGSREGE